MKNRFQQKNTLDRARDLSRTNLLFIFGIIKAASIGVAVTVFLQLFLNIGEHWVWSKIFIKLPDFLFWAISFLSLLVTFDAAMFATVFMIHVPKKAESFFTFMLVGTETLQFAILSPNILVNKEHPIVLGVTTQHWWFVIFSFYCFFILCLIINSKREILETINDFEFSIKNVVEKYLSKFNVGVTLLGIAIFISLISFFVVEKLLFSGVDIHLYKLVVLMLLLILAHLGFFMQHRQRDVIEKMLQSKEDSE